MKAKHTEGPWVARGTKVFVLNSTSGVAIANCNTNFVDQTNPWKDAQLMAAAPDLLEALQVLLSKAEKRTPVYQHEITQAQAAVTKALEGSNET